MQRFALRWYHKVMLKQQVRRKQLVLSLAQNEKSYALSLRALGETYGSPAFEPFTRLPEVASLFADMFLLLSYHNNLHDTLSQRYLRWNVDSSSATFFRSLCVSIFVYFVLTSCLQVNFLREEESKYRSKYQQLLGMVTEWTKNAPGRYATFHALKAGDLLVEDALALPQSA